jgi:ABC-type uncharacterized transport system ATPase subunit
MKVLSGVYGIGTYSGKILIDGVAQRFAAPVDARRAGIAVVYQELTLVPELTVAQNLMLGREPRRWGLIDEARLEATARGQLRRFGLEGAMAVTEPARLGIGLKQMVEVIRALPQEARISSSTNPLRPSPRATELLLAWFPICRATSTACVRPHRLDELFALCDHHSPSRRKDGGHAGRPRPPDSVVRRCGAIGRVEEIARTSTRPVLEVSELCVRRATDPTRGGSVLRRFLTFRSRCGAARFSPFAARWGPGERRSCRRFGCARAG